MTLAEKIKKVREHSGYTQEELALKIGIPQRTLQNYEVGMTKKIPASLLESICLIFPKYIQWLMLPNSTDIGDVPDIVETRLPVISWAQAKVFAQQNVLLDVLTPFNNANVFTHYQVSDSAFALVVSDNKMENSAHPYHTPMGAYVVIDPKQELKADSLIVALYDNEVIYKHYTVDMGNAFLSSINSNYPSVHIDINKFTYIGTVVEIHVINKVMRED